MTVAGIVGNVGEILTTAAAIVAGVKAWLVDTKSKRIEKQVSEIRAMLIQQQTQRQTQNITVNVGTGTASAQTEGAITISDSEEPG